MVRLRAIPGAAGIDHDCATDDEALCARRSSPPPGSRNWVAQILTERQLGAREVDAAGIEMLLNSGIGREEDHSGRRSTSFCRWRASDARRGRSRARPTREKPCSAQTR